MADQIEIGQNERAALIQAGITDPVQQVLAVAMYFRPNIDAVRDIVNSGFKFRLERQILVREVTSGQRLPRIGSPGEFFRSVYLNYIATGNLHMTELMLMAEADMDCMNSLSYGPLQLATLIRDRDIRWKMVKMLMSAGVKPVNENLKYYCTTSVHLAVSVRDIELVKLYLDAGASLNCLDICKIQSPLHLAAIQAVNDETQFELVKQLVLLGANVNITNRKGWTVLHHLSAWSYAHRESLWKLMELLLDLGADLNIIDQDHVSPLAVAASTGQYKLVEKMMEAGADVNISKRCTGSPLQLAVSSNKPAIVNLLLEKGADINVRDDDGNNILCYAAINLKISEQRPRVITEASQLISITSEEKSHNLNILKIILSRNVPIDCPEYGQYKPMDSAIRSGNFVAVDLFCKNGLDLKTSSVPFPLHQAAYSGNGEIMKYLLDKRLYDVDEVDDSGLTPLLIAASHRFCAPALELIKSGADVNKGFKEVISIKEAHNLCFRSPLSKVILLKFLAPLNPMAFWENFSHQYASHYSIFDVLLSAGANIDSYDIFQACQILFDSNRNRPRGALINPDGRIDGNPARKDNLDLIFTEAIIKPLIKQVALLKMQKRRFKFPGVEKVFAENVPEYFQLMEEYSTELEVMKTSTLFEDVTFYDLLIGKDVTHIVNNDRVIAKLESTEISQMFTMYHSRLNYCFVIATAKRKAMDDAIQVLNKLVGSHINELYLILHKIMTHLQIKDLLTLSSMMQV
ncbi:hypothetical protein QAD02_006714 [Eretmocerus hayati]|uniref:Uncharacterized protein n=1 Tax=Eretmocerus hayati TaxID=131215 RepID=A0ACC2N403_9HYME|nr:hypothetical protein QAD02_006714 [Eretmocerus hayati]